MFQWRSHGMAWFRSSLAFRMATRPLQSLEGECGPLVKTGLALVGKTWLEHVKARGASKAESRNCIRVHMCPVEEEVEKKKKKKKLSSNVFTLSGQITTGSLRLPGIQYE